MNTRECKLSTDQRCILVTVTNLISLIFTYIHLTHASRMPSEESGRGTAGCIPCSRSSLSICRAAGGKLCVFATDKQTPTLHLVWKKLRETLLMFCSGSRGSARRPRRGRCRRPAVPRLSQGRRRDSRACPAQPFPPAPVQHGVLARRLAGTRAAAGPDGTEARGSAPRAGSEQPALRR